MAVPIRTSLIFGWAGDSFFVKREAKKKREAIIHHAERYGTRQSKYDYLDDHDLGSTEWKR